MTLTLTLILSLLSFAAIVSFFCQVAKQSFLNALVDLSLSATNITERFHCKYGIYA